MPEIIYSGTQAIPITLHSVHSPAVAATGRWEAPVLQENSDDSLLLKFVLLRLRTAVLTCENLGFLTNTDSSNTLVLSFVICVQLT